MRGSHSSSLEVGRCRGVDDGRRHCQTKGGTRDGVAGDGHTDGAIRTVDVGEYVVGLYNLGLVAVEVNECGIDDSGSGEHDRKADPVNSGYERLNASTVRYIGDEEVLGTGDVVDTNNGDILCAGERCRGGTGHRVGRLRGDKTEIDFTTGTGTGCSHASHEVVNEIGVLGTGRHTEANRQGKNSGTRWSSCDGESILIVGSTRNDTLHGVAGVVDVVEHCAVVSERKEVDSSRVFYTSGDQSLLVGVESVRGTSTLGSDNTSGGDGPRAGPHLHGDLGVAAVGSEMLVGVESLVGIHLVEVDRHASPRVGVVVEVREVDNVTGGLEVSHRLPVAIVIVSVDTVRDGGMTWQVGESSFERGDVDSVNKVIQVVDIVLQVIDVMIRRTRDPESDAQANSKNHNGYTDDAENNPSSARAHL